MSTLLFKLSNVPADEADEVRQLLADNNIDYYETSAGFFGTSVAGLWLQNKDQFGEAKSLLQQYQQDRYQRVQTEYRDQLGRGEAETLWRRFKVQPIKVTLCLAFVIAVLCISILPFLGIDFRRD